MVTQAWPYLAVAGLAVGIIAGCVAVTEHQHSRSLGVVQAGTIIVFWIAVVAFCLGLEIAFGMACYELVT